MECLTFARTVVFSFGRRRHLTRQSEHSAHLDIASVAKRKPPSLILHKASSCFPGPTKICEEEMLHFLRVVSTSVGR